MASRTEEPSAERSESDDSTPTAAAVRASLLELAGRGDSEALLRLLADDRVDVAGDPPRLANGDTALHVAASGGHVAAVVALLGAGASAHALGHRLRSPLHCAVARGHLQTARRLLDAGARGDVQDQDGATALELVLGNGSYAMIRLFVKADKSHTLTKVVLRLLRRGGARAAKSLKAALQNAQSADVVRAYADAAPEQVRGEAGRGAVLLAAREGRAEVVDALLEAGVSPDVRMYGNCTALHLAALYGRAACVRKLLEWGADVNAKEMGGGTPLHKACFRGNAECVRELLGNAFIDVNAKEDSGWTPLHEACYRGKEECVEKLLWRGADVNAKDIREWTPLHKASSRGHAEIVKMLLEEGADVNAKDRGGWTALHWASEGGYVKSVQMLVDRGGECNGKDNVGKTPIFRASMKSHWECVEVLVKSVPKGKPGDNEDGIPYHPIFNGELLEITRELTRGQKKIDYGSSRYLRNLRFKVFSYFPHF